MRYNRFWQSLPLVGVLGMLLLVGAPSCKRDKSEASGAPSSSAAVAGPKVGFDATSHDFGTVTEGDKVTHSFKVTNQGTAPLVLDKIRTSCGCAVATPESKEIAPGASTQLKVTFDTRGRRNRQKKTVTITSNDPDSPHTLQISAKVLSLLAFEPRHVQLSTKHGKEVVREAWLTGKLADQATLAITEVEGDESDEKKVVSIELAEKQEKGKALRGLRFTMKGDKVGYGRGNVTVSTQVDNPSTLKLFFNWSVTGNLQGVPRQLYFSGRGSGGQKRVLRVRSKRDDFKLKSVRVVEGPFEAKRLPADEKDKQRNAGEKVEVSVTSAMAQEKDKKVHTGKLILVSNDPLEPEKSVQLTLRPMPKGRQVRGRGPHSRPEGRPPRPRPRLPKQGRPPAPAPAPNP